MRLAAILVSAAMLAVSAEARESPAESGQQLYLDECARCHGVDRKGDGPDAPFFAPGPRDLTTGFLDEYSTVELVARLRDGTPLSLATDAEARRARAKRVEAIVAHLQKLPDIDWEAVDAGGVVFGARCEVCHGPFGKPWPEIELPPGVQTPPRDLRLPAFQRSVSDEELVRAFRHGKSGMPALSPQLTEEESEQLVAFVRVLSPGFEDYSYYCAPCHGDSGLGGGILPREGEGPQVDLDREYLKKQDSDELRAHVWHMIDASGGGMPHLAGVVEDERLERIVEYLKRTP